MPPTTPPNALDHVDAVRLAREGANRAARAANVAPAAIYPVILWTVERTMGAAQAAYTGDLDAWWLANP
jgi:hypothetical protein